MATSSKVGIRIDRALEDHPLLKGKNVQIQRDNRRVVLEGDVTSYYDKQLVQEIVRRIDGVEEVDNRLLVDWAAVSEEHEAAAESLY